MDKDIEKLVEKANEELGSTSSRFTKPYCIWLEQRLIKVEKEAQDLRDQIEDDNTLLVETKECGDCHHFKLDPGAFRFGICKKKHMTVVSTMHVTYKKVEGTCFVQSTQQK